MAKVNDVEIYKLEKYPTLQDYLLGSKQINGKTENFPLLAIVQLINSVNGIDAIQFRFSDGSDPDITFNTKGTFFTDTNNVEVGGFSELIFNKATLSATDLSVLFSFLGARNDILIRLVNPSNPNTFFVFKITGFEDLETYFVFDVEPQDNLHIGQLTNDTVYSVYWDQAVGDNLKLDKSTYEGNAQDLADSISAIQSPDEVLKIGEINLVGLNLSIDANAFSWRIDQIEYNTPAAFTQTLIAATANYFRYDILQGNELGGYSIKQGVESISIGTPPNPDNNCISLSDILIFGNTVEETLVANTSLANIFGTGGDLDYVFLNTTANLFYVFNTLSISGVSLPQQNLSFGKDYYIRNNTSDPIVLKSAIGTNTIQFFFPEGDLTLPGFNTIHCKYLPDGRTGKGYLVYVGLNTIPGNPTLSKFSLVQKITNNQNTNIELGDYAKGFGPGSGVDVEYWNLAIYENLTADNNVHNYLNYKPISVVLPNS